MNEQRLQEYLNLIQALLECPNEEEINNTLNAHPHLIDRDLVEVMQKVAAMMLQKGNENTARFFTDLAQQIAAYLGLQLSPESQQEYINFLVEVLVATIESNGNPQVVYPILAANQDKLNHKLVAWYPDWAKHILYQATAEKAASYATGFFYFSNLIQQFPLGNRASNVDIAIIGYELILNILTREDFPQAWAMTHNNLGIAYSDKITGNQAQNIDAAIRCFQRALEVYTRDNFPENWAATENNLGTAYKSKITGNWTENIKEAIACYQRALEVRTHEDFPENWAATQNNLGNAYSNKTIGNRPLNIDEAITCYNLALEVYTRDNFPKKWAMTQHNLGNSYFDKITGNRAENIDEAIRCYQGALDVYTREDFPENWAMTQYNLGNSYSEKINGNRAENIDEAIRCYQGALDVYTRENFPENWAMTHNNLGNAYSGKITGNRAENIDAAIRCYQRSLDVYTRENFPQDWAGTQYNLGCAYSNKITGNRAQNIDEAIRCYRLALEFWTPTTLPLDCLKSGINLGNLGFKEGNWEIVIEGYETAINAVEKSRSWSKTDASSQQIIADYIDVYANIIQAYINTGNLEKAIAYVDRSRAKRLVDLIASNDLYAGGEIPPQVQEYLQQYDQLQSQIDAQQNRLQNNSDSSKQQTEQSTNKGSFALTRAAYQAASEEIEKLESEKQKVWEQMRRLDPVLAGEKEVTPLDFPTIQQLIENPQTAILNFFTTGNDTHIFIIYAHKKPELHTCAGFGYQTLRDLVEGDWLNLYLTKKEDGVWYGKISEFLQQLAEKIQLKTLVETYLTGIEELIIIPHLFWHQIPFAALPLTVLIKSQTPENKPSGIMRQVIEIFTRLEKKKTTTNVSMPSESEIISTQYLGDKFPIRYIPSSQILQYCQQRPPLSQINYGTVENPDGSLPSVEFECEKIANLHKIPAHQRLKGREQATVNNYRQLAKQVQVLHSSHHAQSRLDSPLESVLKLADGDITLGQIMTPGFRFPHLFDVFLSCCETNLGVAGISDDILSLSTGFLCAGARNVVSTLWAVDDLATALFSIFYYQYRQQGLNRPQALREAQITLRNLPGTTLKKDYKAELEIHYQQQLQLAEEKRKKADKNLKLLQEGTPDYQRWDEESKHYNAIGNRIFRVKENLKTLCREKYPFAQPVYWAGFICSGLR